LAITQLPPGSWSRRLHNPCGSPRRVHDSREQPLGGDGPGSLLLHLQMVIHLAQPYQGSEFALSGLGVGPRDCFDGMSHFFPPRIALHIGFGRLHVSSAHAHAWGFGRQQTRAEVSGEPSSNPATPYLPGSSARIWYCKSRQRLQLGPVDTYDDLAAYLTL